MLVAACDKRHNLFALVWDVRTHGPGYLERFNSAPREQLWYFEAIVGAIRGRVCPSACKANSKPWSTTSGAWSERTSSARGPSGCVRLC